MAVNREYIINKVKQAVELLPSNGLILREFTNRYNEKEGYKKISSTRGVLYSEDTNRRDITISLQDKGQILPKTSKNYLISYEENPSKMQKADLIFIEDKVYKITNPGENLKMYFLMQLEEVEGIKLVGNTVVENGSIYQILEV